VGLILRVHQWLYEKTGGRIGHRLLGVPCLLLRTTGRRTGTTRTAALVYAKDDGRYAVVASNGGADQPPGWLYNVRANPKVEVALGPATKSATARIVERADPDYERLWQLVNANNGDRYNGYQRRTERPIPVVVLDPTPVAADGAGA